MASKKEEYWVRCVHCGNKPRRHIVLHKETDDLYDEPDGVILSKTFHRFVRCGGCNNVKYVVSSLDAFRFDDPYGDDVSKVYPDDASSKEEDSYHGINQMQDDKGKQIIPESVLKMYNETVKAIKADIRTLAGAGIRAIVEAVCLDKGIVGPNLVGKIDELGTKRFLGESEAEFLHEQRHLGNAAVHELQTPSARDLADSLDIVEGLIRNIYVYPLKAKRLKTQRELAKTKKRKTK